ncbi:RadC family protein [Paenibacillus sp. GCM10012307]|uniref:JAB domain-containing protein n=1 Tax=Paenibacillus TaxID=44249 RepID=UPI001E582DD5|nr:DNA repair protein RadC [Paenibacillus roseus]
MITISVYSVKQVKTKGGLYNLDSKVIRSPRDAYQIIQTVLDIEHEATEVFGILTLNVKMAVAGIHVLSTGGLSSAIVHPREVFKAAILNNATSIICFHNHPSGDISPSLEDIKMTERLKDAGELMGIPLMDHVIIGDGQYFSFQEQGMIIVG